MVVTEQRALWAFQIGQHPHAPTAITTLVTSGLTPTFCRHVLGEACESYLQIGFSLLCFQSLSDDKLLGNSCIVLVVVDLELQLCSYSLLYLGACLSSLSCSRT
jgi:hypothetical protein